MTETKLTKKKFSTFEEIAKKRRLITQRLQSIHTISLNLLLVVTTWLFGYGYRLFGRDLNINSLWELGSCLRQHPVRSPVSQLCHQPRTQLFCIIQFPDVSFVHNHVTVRNDVMSPAMRARAVIGQIFSRDADWTRNNLVETCGTVKTENSTTYSQHVILES